MSWTTMSLVAETLFEAGYSKAGVFKYLLGEFIGTPYVWGGSSPNGSDCSGSVCACLSCALGKRIRVTADELLRGCFLKPIRSLEGHEDDIVAAFFLDENNKAVHVAGYQGKDRFVNVSRVEPNEMGSTRSISELKDMYRGLKCTLRVLPLDDGKVITVQQVQARSKAHDMRSTAAFLTNARHSKRKRGLAAGSAERVWSSIDRRNKEVLGERLAV